MIKETIKEYSIKRVHRDYYCDACGKLIDSVDSYDDGYIPPSNGKIEEKVCFNGTWLEYKRCFCNKCRDIELAKIRDSLNTLGFVEDEDD